MKELIGKTISALLCCLLAGPAVADRLYLSGPPLRTELPITGQFPGVGSYVYPLCRVDIPAAQAGDQFILHFQFSATNDSWLRGPNRGAMLSAGLWMCEPDRTCTRLDKLEAAGTGVVGRAVNGGYNLTPELHHDLRLLGGAVVVEHARGGFTFEIMARSASKWLNSNRKGKRDKSREHLDIHWCAGWVQRIPHDPLPD